MFNFANEVEAYCKLIVESEFLSILFTTQTFILLYFSLVSILK